MRIVTIIGARPQFIKAAIVSRSLREKGVKEILIHTGQHYDEKMSNVFFEELGLDKPQINLGINNSSNIHQTARVMMELEEPIKKIAPDFIIVYGDTNATLAGALVGAQLQIPVIHIEAGLRSFDQRMPEETNRVITDRISTMLFCPTQKAVENLKKEGIEDNVFNVGDVMYDAVLLFKDIAKRKSRIIEKLHLKSKEYILATVHRNFNTDNPERMNEILKAFARCGQQVVLPLHPRTKKMIEKFNLQGYFEETNIKFINPVGYLDMLMLQQGASVVVTDSGGIQKEAYFHKVPFVILRENTEWVELLDINWAVLTNIYHEHIINAINSIKVGDEDSYPYGNGEAGNLIANKIESFYKLINRKNIKMYCEIED